MHNRVHACVVILGDLGHSPRMQYHALSLARQASLEVDIVAYGGSEPHSAVIENESIHIHTTIQRQKHSHSLPKILYPLMLLLKPIIQFVILLWFLCFKVLPPDAFIVQNPPSIPTLMVVKWVSSLRKSAFIVDWHNFGYTLLGLSVGRSSPFVSIYRVLWKEISGGKQYLYPRLLFIITGKGPEKEKYEEKIKRLNLKRVAFRTMWLSTEEYPLLLGSADLGVYWHTSSSGLDLPMKVVDMFGCGLPVCAVSYSW
uniref:Glycosyltransferase subfamily 4-like N-terminal domain-containing protein n=1 Tax=Gossypium raimondii TaxID=29730 RepID=A0A0D2SPU6_GOSRA|nr:hypothetical protein B456_006G005600 [Gossypium raimondii]KJB33285.1 hypothetical protein B456_006G005600 [Gossypium raimondii]